MISIRDNRGYAQGYRPTEALMIRTQRRGRYIIDRLSPKSGTNVVELGCGTGYLAFLLASQTTAHVTGIDICGPFVDFANARFKLPNLSYVNLDCGREEVLARLAEEAPIDYFVGNGILHHFYHRLDEILRTLRHVLNSDGKIVFLEPNIYNPLCFLIFRFAPVRRWFRLEPKEMAFSKNYIEKRLSDAGFHDISVEFKDLLLPVIPGRLIRPVLRLERILEPRFFFRWLSQSIFIAATK